MPGGEAVTVRPPIAVLLSRFPLITETFILREIDELERQGQPVLLAPLIRERPEVVHREATPWVERALFTPFFSAEVVLANLRLLRRRPGRYLAVVLRALMGTLPDPGFFVRALAILPKSVLLAERFERAGVAHVHAHFATHPALAAWVISSLSGIGYSITAHAHDIFASRTFLGEKLRRARFVRAISFFNREFLRAHYPDLPPDRLVVIRVGIDPDRYRPRGADSGGLPLVLCVASLKPYKGLPVLIDACRALAARGVAFRCQLVGGGPLRAALEGSIAASGLGERVRCSGPLPQHEVRRLLAEAAIAVQPSVVADDGQMEGIPVSLMEALASGKPVVASSLSGIPELVEDRVSGRLVPPGDAAALAEAIAELLAAPDERHRMGAAGRRKVESEFRLSDCTGELLRRIDAVTAPLAPELERTLGEVAREVRCDALGVRGIESREDSSVVRVLASRDGEARELIVKIHARRDRAAAEHDALNALREHLGDAGRFRVPLPLGRWERAVVMEHRRGEPLDALVRRARGAAREADRARLESAVRRSGAWLRAVQARTRRPGDSEAALATLRRRAEADLALCGDAGVGASWCERVRARIATLAADRSALPSSLVGCQGDLWPGNVSVDELGVEVIDHEGYHEGLEWEDPAYFLTQLELYFAYPLLHGRFGRHRDAFLEECFAERGPAARSLWDLCRTASALRVLARSLERPAGAAWQRFRRHRILRRLALPHEVP